MTGFLASALSAAVEVPLDFDEVSFAMEDLEEPRAPETVPARDEREGALDAEALEPAPVEAVDLDVGTLEAMKISDDGRFPASGKRRD
jgi:hypothetical protein